MPRETSNERINHPNHRLDIGDSIIVEWDHFCLNIAPDSDDAEETSYF